MIHIKGTQARPIVTRLLVLCAAWGTARAAAACTTVMVGKRATEDGSVLMASSCDGDVMGVIYVMAAQTYPPDTKLPMYWNLPRPKNYEEYQANVRKGYDLVGFLPTTRTYRSIILAGNLESMTTGGLNEHGLSIAIEFLGLQADVEKAAASVFEESGARAAEAFLTDYARRCVTKVGYAYHDLVNYLMFRYLLGYKELAPPTLPEIAAPVIPDIP